LIGVSIFLIRFVNSSLHVCVRLGDLFAAVLADRVLGANPILATRGICVAAVNARIGNAGPAVNLAPFCS